jgi:hypothetical protein
MAQDGLFGPQMIVYHDTEHVWQCPTCGTYMVGCAISPHEFPDHPGRVWRSSWHMGFCDGRTVYVENPRPEILAAWRLGGQPALDALSLAERASSKP